MIRIILLLFLVPSFTFANNENFIIDNSRVSAKNPGDTGPIGLTSGSVQQEPPQNEANETQAQDLGDSGGFQINQGGLDASQSQESRGKSVQIQGLIVGGMMARQCGPRNPTACALAVMAFGDSLSGGSSKYASFDAGQYFDTASDGSNFDASSFEDDPATIEAQKNIKSLAGMGFTLNKDGSVNTPSGQVVTSSDVQTLEGLQSLGLDTQAAQKISSDLASAKKLALEKAEAAKSELEEGVAVKAQVGQAQQSLGGGGAPILGADKVIEEIEYRGHRLKNKNRMPASQAATLSKNFNGDPIGIGMADLFLIVHQKYREKKNKKTEFIQREF